MPTKRGSGSSSGSGGGKRGARILPIYRLFFLWIEPVSALVGAYYAQFLPTTYLALTLHARPNELDLASGAAVGTRVVLSQLANLYLLFALNEALVLRCTADRRVWKTLLTGLLIADLGHLYSVRDLGVERYWSVATWNAMDWGNLGFVYLGASMRIAFLLGVGQGGGVSSGA